MEEKKEAIIGKIMKLLELSNEEKNNNPHEREAAAKMAAKLMADWSLDFIDLKTSKPKGDTFVTFEVDGSSEVKIDYEASLAWAISKAFDCKVINSNNKGYWQMIFIGSKHDIEIAVYFFKFLRRTLHAMSFKNVNKESLIAQNPYLGKVTAKYLNDARRNYSFGMVKTIDERLVELYTKREEFIPSDCKSLIVVKKDDLNKFMHEAFPNLRSSHTKALRGDMNAYRNGQADGRSVNLSRPISNNGGSSAQIGA